MSELVLTGLFGIEGGYSVTRTEQTAAELFTVTLADELAMPSTSNAPGTVRAVYWWRLFEV